MSISDWRQEVVERDMCCVAPVVDRAELNSCYDAMGQPMSACEREKCEADYVRFGAVGGRHQFARDHVLMCPGHHRGTGPQAGRQWATAHRQELRAYLEERYKDA